MPHFFIAMSKIDSLLHCRKTIRTRRLVCDDADRMLANFAFQKADWKSLRTTKPIESVFANVQVLWCGDLDAEPWAEVGLVLAAWLVRGNRA